PAIGPYAAIIDEWLVADREVPRKQRHTARRGWQRRGARARGGGGGGAGVGGWGRAPARAGAEKDEGTGAATRAPGPRGRGGVGGVPRAGRRGLAEAVDVRDAAIVLGPGLPRGVRHPGAGGVPGRSRAGVRVLRRGAGPGPV